MTKILFWLTIILLTLSITPKTPKKRESVISINVYVVRDVFEEHEPYDWVLVVKDVVTGEYSEFRTFGDIGDTLIRVQYNKLIIEEWWGLETTYKRTTWYTYSESKLLEIQKEYETYY